MKMHLRSLGCRLNQAEMDALGRNLLQRGHELTGDPKHAGEIVVNTCSVTREAGADSRALVREMGRRAPAARITVTGCHAELGSAGIAVPAQRAAGCRQHGKGRHRRLA